MKKTLGILIPALLLVAFVAGGLVVRNQTIKKETYYAELISAAEAEEAAAQTAYDTVDTSAVEAVEAELAAVQAEAAKTEEQTQTLTGENTTLDADMAAAQQEYDTLAEEEENAYYLTIYESLSEGKEKVEELIDNQ